MVELGEQVYWKVPGFSQHEFGDRWRPGTLLGKAERAKTSLQTPTECALPDPYNADLYSTVGTTLMEPRFLHMFFTWAVVQKHDPQDASRATRCAWRTLGCVQIWIRAHLGG